MNEQGVQWSIQMIDSFIQRYPKIYEAINYQGKWSYDYGVVLKGIADVWRETQNKDYFNYIKTNMDYFISESGDIKNYKQQLFNIDYINNGKILLFLYKETGEMRYKIAANQLYEQLQNQPRTSEGAFWHKQIYPYQIWLDGLYMGSPFYLEFIQTFKVGNVEDVIQQFVICDKYTRDDKTHLRHHAFDEHKVQPWCDPDTGLSKHFWSRSIGWYLMALIDIYEMLPEQSTHRKTIQEIFTDALAGVVSFQDTSGVWYQITNQGNRKPNYLESSGSSMFLYALAKGKRLGILDNDEWQDAMHKAYQGILNEFVLTTKEGWVNLYKCCEVAGLGGKDERDGSFAYYMSENIITNDFKAIGAFIQAMHEYENITKS